jgi:ligand-binding sensor domain-containing protein
VDFLYVDSRSRIWVAATTEHGSRLACYDTQADAWKVCSDSDALIGNSNVEDLTEDSRGCLYFATSGNGIITFDGNTWAQHPVNEYLPHIPPVEIPPDATEETKARLGPWTNGVKIPTSAVFCDREDNLWIGSHVYLVKCPARWEGESPMTGGAGDEGRKE